VTPIAEEQKPRNKWNLFCARRNLHDMNTTTPMVMTKDLYFIWSLIEKTLISTAYSMFLAGQLHF